MKLLVNTQRGSGSTALRVLRTMTTVKARVGRSVEYADQPLGKFTINEGAYYAEFTNAKIAR